MKIITGEKKALGSQPRSNAGRNPIISLHLQWAASSGCNINWKYRPHPALQRWRKPALQLTGHSSLTVKPLWVQAVSTPTSPSNGSCFGLRLVILLGEWEGVSERSLCRKGFTPVKMTPKFPRKIHWRAEVSRDSLSHMSSGLREVTELRGSCHRQGGHPLAQVFLPAVPAWARGRQLVVLPPHPSHCRGLRGNLEPGKMQERFGMCCGAPATYPLSPPSSGQGRSSYAPAPTLYTKHTKEPIPQQSLLTRWDKASPGGSRSHLTGFKGEKCTPHHGWAWPEECTNSRIHPTKPNTDSPAPQTPATSSSPRSGTARKRFQKASASLKRQLRKGWQSKYAQVSQRERTALGYPRAAAWRQTLPLRLYTKVTKSTGDIILHLLSLISQC